jgi:hypothetical protein
MTSPNSYIVTGTLSDEQTVALDKPLPIRGGKVRVVVEPIETAQRSYTEVMAAIRERQRRRRHRPPTREEVDAYIRAERASWGD